MHSAICILNFIPLQTDSRLWEVVINDYQYSSSPHIPEEASRKAQTQSMILSWLQEVERMHMNSNTNTNTPPPKVILVYLWKFLFKLNAQTMNINNSVYDYHTDIAKQFDFVVGHVNLASFMDHELNDGMLDDFDNAKRMFLTDAHHPNKVGHLAVTYLLMTLLHGLCEWVTAARNNESDDDNDNDNDTDNDDIPLVPVGDDDTDEVESKRLHRTDDDSADDKKFLWSLAVQKHLISSRDTICSNDDNNSTASAPASALYSYRGLRSPLGSMTYDMEQPQNRDRTAGPRQMMVDIQGRETVILGKKNPLGEINKGS
eukprot:scaffold1987_cov236-Chaetoceros_neogracile.AAC.7